MKHSITGVDLAKDVIQVCVVRRNKVKFNKEMTILEFSSWLASSKGMTIVFEACATSNYWKQKAREMGHDARLVSAKLVSKIRENQKTDANDALAVAQAGQLVSVNYIKGKSFTQQQLQSILRMRELAVEHKVAQANQLGSLLLEFNIRVSPSKGGVNGVVQGVLEDADNGFSLPFRKALQGCWQAYLDTISRISEYDKQLHKAMRVHPECVKLLALEGVSTINAVNLFIALFCGDAGVFKTGRDAAACIGVTPIQHSSGGKAKIGSIGKHVKNTGMRSTLISGAMSVVQQVYKREPRTAKEQWLKQLIERRGKKCAAVALANKTVRTAFAMLSQGTEYRVEPLRI
ncbi:MAG: IS110 family transposase [Bacteroidetes bacterium]|nr:IS110 family transposase [Bacteroidota bacterium]